MNWNKIKNIFQERRLPYFIEHRLQYVINMTFFRLNRFLSGLSWIGLIPRRDYESVVITFKCGFHGQTGGVFAIASIANMLAKRYRVEFVSYSSSYYNRVLSHQVRLVKRANLDSNLFVCDVSCDHKFFEALKRRHKKVLVSCHGFLNASHDLLPEYVERSLSYADVVHVVSAVQQDSFQLPKNKVVVIPNATTKIHKMSSTRNAGCVGNLNLKSKNVQRSVEIVLQSDVEKIHLYSMDNDYWHNPRVVLHRWESNKRRIYNSFDVLVFMSEIETFGLVVIEAMSAGIPCMLSDIPAFRQFKDAPGVVLIGGANCNT
ncbi:MAG: glycosyltransferase family 4 protein, partial [Gammaproteobacteria bacterium]